MGVNEDMHTVVGMKRVFKIEMIAVPRVAVEFAARPAV